MSKLSKDEIADIVSRHGYRIVAQQKPDVRPVQVDGATPELSKLQSKYARGTGARSAADAVVCESPTLEGENGPGDDDTIVVVEPATKRDAFTRGNRPKAKVISGKKKDFTGSQG